VKRYFDFNTLHVSAPNRGAPKGAAEVQPPQTKIQKTQKTDKKYMINPYAKISHSNRPMTTELRFLKIK
jgi:hypothetical protein